MDEATQKEAERMQRARKRVLDQQRNDRMRYMEHVRRMRQLFAQSEAYAKAEKRSDILSAKNAARELRNLAR